MNDSARNYDPYSQKFLSEDPNGFAGQDANLYRYVGNRPLVSNDPNGKIAKWILAAGGFLALAIAYKFFVEPYIDSQTDANFFINDANGADEIPPRKGCDPGLQSCPPPEPRECQGMRGGY